MSRAKVFSEVMYVFIFATAISNAKVGTKIQSTLFQLW